MDGGSHSVSRRSLFKGSFSSEEKCAQSWHQVESLAAGAGDVFWGGWADQEGAFVVGDDGAVFHYNGTSWSRQPVPAPVPIHAVWGLSRDNLWAVGWMGLILHHNGENWRQVQGCVVDENGKYGTVPENTPLFDIAGAADGNAWAVGDRGKILRFDGADWVAEDSGTRAHLRCVAILPDGRVMAAGGDGTVLVRDAAGIWSRESCEVHSNFVDALVLSDGHVLLAGGRYFVEANGFRGDLVLWDGANFTKLFTDGKFARFRSLAAYKNGIVAVGDGGQIHLIRDDKIDRVDSGTTHDLLGIVAIPGEGALVVGDFGMVLAGSESELENFAPFVASDEGQPVWEPMESGTTSQLWGLWHDEMRDELYACGEEGTVLFRDRGQWEALPPVGKLGIHTLNRAADGGLLAAGQMGEIHHFDGSVWNKVFDLHMDITILSLWSDGANYVAAGDEGLILKKSADLPDWTRMASGTKSALYGLWGPDDSHLLAVGDFGLVQRWNGTRWDEFNAGTEYFLFDVWGRGLDDIFVVGLSGTIGHFDGQRWTIKPARARSDLLAVAGDDDHVVAVGAAGTVYCHNGHNWLPDLSGSDAGLRAVSTTPGGGFAAAGDQGTLLSRSFDI